MFNTRTKSFRNRFFFVILILLCLAYSYIDILGFRPKSIHQFRQADCLSLTDNYYNGNWKLFQPELNIQFSDNLTSGKTAGEFPLLYYFVAILWKIFGKHEFLFRLITIAFSFVGMFALFKLVYGILKDYFWAVASVVLLFSSPIFVYYSNNFLVNVPAFSLMLVGLYYFYLFWQSGENKHLYICMGFYLLAGLFKVSALLSFVVIGFIYLADISKLIRFKSDGRLFNEPLKQLFPFVAVVAGVGAWYLYAGHFSHVHGGQYTYNGTASYWSMTEKEHQGTWDSVQNFLLYQVYSVSAFIYFITCLLVLAFNFRKVSLIWRIAIPLLLIGYFIFILLFFYSLNFHDYYHIDFLIIPVIINLAFLRYLHVNEIWILRSPMIKIFFSIFLLYNVLYCANNIRIRYWQTNDSNKAYRQIFAPKSDIDYWGWCTWAYPYGSYEKVTPILRSMGIKRDDLFLCPNDQSFSIQLYLIDQKGFPNLCEWMSDSAGVSRRIQAGAKYMIVNDTTILKTPAFKPFVKHKIRQFENLQIYDLRPYKLVR
jgi:hypothetical protein